MPRATTYLHGDAPRTTVDGIEIVGMVPAAHVSASGSDSYVLFNDDGGVGSSQYFKFNATTYQLDFSPAGSLTHLAEPVTGGARDTVTLKAFIAGGLESNLALRSRSATIDGADFTLTAGTMLLFGDHTGVLTWDSNAIWHAGNHAGSGDPHPQYALESAIGTAAAQNTGTSGATLPFCNTANTWQLAQTFTVAPVFTDQSGSRTALGLGTMATQNANGVTGNVVLSSGYLRASGGFWADNGALARPNGGTGILLGDATHEYRADTHTFYNSAAGVLLATLNSTGLAVPAAIKSSSATAGVGYATGAGGTVAQATSKSTGVTLNKVSGQITMNAAALAAGAEVSFTLTNSTIAATDLVYPCIASGATAATYTVTVDAVAAGSCRITVGNHSTTSRSEPIVLNFFVFKGVNA
jgi:hypothetical protein